MDGENNDNNGKSLLNWMIWGYHYFSETRGVIRRVSLRVVGGFNPSEKYARQIGSFPQGSG